MDVGFSEILMLAVLALLIFGPERLPGIARSVGRTVGQIRREASSTFEALRDEVELDELRDLRDELRSERDALRRQGSELRRLSDLSETDGATADGGTAGRSASPPRFDPQAT